MSKDNFKRYRFSVPNADTSVNDWIAVQTNLSMSLRLLIGEYIEKYGYEDATCRRKERVSMSESQEMPHLMTALNLEKSAPFIVSDKKGVLLEPMKQYSKEHGYEIQEYNVGDISDINVNDIYPNSEPVQKQPDIKQIPPEPPIGRSPEPTQRPPVSRKMNGSGSDMLADLL